LDISRLDAGAMATDVREFPISDLLKPLHAEFSALARDRGLGFDLVPSRAIVVSDPKLLRRVLQNFISNALRYTEVGRVALGCRRLAGHLSLQVWDTGPGIPADQTDSIFREFHRLEASHRSEDRGLGLGLAIVERIARILDHPIEVRSVAGRGTMFALSVPLATNQLTPPVKQSLRPRRPGRDLAGMKVLCVDNETDILIGMQALIEPWGCDVRTASDEEGAVAELNAGWMPAVVVADYHLDDARNGIDLMNRLQARFSAEISGILITADQTEPVRNEARANGYRFLQKPLKPAALRALLSHLASFAKRDQPAD
ncbi:MAG TPA: hybrid sensor histidine kinase/response regulator, partial [Wenzhouxiangella sp.]|nr:hybrid sensor histidine kinase/response regulator [Wenzhouxiangella sp.]